MPCGIAGSKSPPSHESDMLLVLACWISESWWCFCLSILIQTSVISYLIDKGWSVQFLFLDKRPVRSLQKRKNRKEKKVRMLLPLCTLLAVYIYFSGAKRGAGEPALAIGCRQDCPPTRSRLLSVFLSGRIAE